MATASSSSPAGETRAGRVATDVDEPRLPSESWESYFASDASDEFFRLAGIEKGELKAYFQKLESRGKKIEILVTGKTGTGKSTLVNALIGEKVAEVGRELKPKTKEVTRYFTTKEGVEITVWDSPGLQDGTDNEEKYLADMGAKCSNVDLVIYCIKATNRAELDRGQHDFAAIQKFTEAFGSQWWENAVFILTYGNFLERKLKYGKENVDQAFQEKIKEWGGKVLGALMYVGIPREIRSKIPLAVAGHVKIKDLPGHKFWLSVLWCTVFCRASETSKLALFRLNRHRLKKRSEVSAKDFQRDGYQQPLVVDEGLESALGVPAMAGTGTALSGAVIGAGVGATLGAAGLGVGAAIGAVAGGAVGAGLGLLVHMWQVHEIKTSKAL